MNKIYTEINERTNGKYSFARFPRVELKDGKVNVTVACAADRLDYVKSCADELKRLIKQICAFHAPVTMNFVAVEQTARSVRDSVTAFIDKFPFAASMAGKITAPSATAVKLEMHKSMYELAKGDFLPRLDDYLDNLFLEHVSVETNVTSFESTREKQNPVKKDVGSPTYNITDIVPLSCENADVFSSDAKSAGVVEGYNEGITVCGVLVMATDFMSKGAGAKRSRPYEKFLLYDGEQTLQCRFFPHGGFSVVGADILGKAVCAVGNAQAERGRSGEMSMTVMEIGTCTAQGLELPKPFPVPSEYINVTPQPYEEYVQASLLEKDDELPSSLRGSFVAFDFETTGLSVNYDMPTELGAV